MHDRIYKILLLSLLVSLLLLLILLLLLLLFWEKRMGKPRDQNIPISSWENSKIH